MTNNKTKVKTRAYLNTTEGMHVSKKHLLNRKPNTTGVFVGYVPGHGGKVFQDGIAEILKLMKLNILIFPIDD